jgi:hypothetical protein
MQHRPSRARLAEKLVSLNNRPTLSFRSLLKKIGDHKLVWESVAPRLLVTNYKDKAMSMGAISRAVMFVSFMKMLSDGPATSLSGSPTVSPVTAAK